MSPSSPLKSSGIVTLTTDFGLSDAYVAQLHAVILQLAPQARIVDVSHDVPAGRAETTLFLTESAWPQFGPGAVHVVVVDPGVGTDRRLIAIETEHAFLVGPDSGVLSSGLPDAMRPSPPESTRQPLPDALRAVEISRSSVRAPVVAPTFQGRDVMAPVAAALAGGSDLASLGEPLTEVVTTPALGALGVAGYVLHIDRFGNAITNFRSEGRSKKTQLVATTGWRDEIPISGLAESYGLAPHDRSALLMGSSGYLEIAWPNGDAAERLGLRVGDSVRLIEP